jgi:hypothetical protein
MGLGRSGFRGCERRRLEKLGLGIPPHHAATIFHRAKILVPALQVGMPTMAKAKPAWLARTLAAENAIPTPEVLV